MNGTPNLDAVFGEIDNNQAVSQYAPRLADGTHTVILNTYKATNSQQNKGVKLEADFIVEKSTAHQVGEKRGWLWLPQRQGWGGVFEKDRIKQFYAGSDFALGIAPRDANATGRALVNGEMRGLRYNVIVSPIFAKNGQRMTDKSGRPLSNAEFSAVPTSREELAANAAKLPAQASPPSQGYAQQPAPHAAHSAPPQGYQPAPQQYQQAPQGYQGQPPQGYQQGPAPTQQGYYPSSAPPPGGYLSSLPR